MSTERVRAVLERMLATGTLIAASDGSVYELAPVATPAAEGESLRAWVRREGATRTIEVGLGYAISTLFICDGLLTNGGASDVRHVAIDPFQSSRFADCGVQLVGEAGLAGVVELRREESQVALPRLLSEGQRFDLAFVDGDHRFDGVFLDLVHLGRLVRRGGIVFVDDYQLQSVERAASFATSNLGWSVEELSRADVDHNWVVLRTPLEPPERPWHHFVDF